MLPLLIRLKTIYNSDYFTNNIVKWFQDNFPNQEWCNNTEMYTNWDNIYKIILNRYGNRFIRYEIEEFNNYFINLLLENLPELYTKQIVFIDNQIGKLLKNVDNWGVQNEINYTGDNSSTNTGLNSNSTTNKGNNNNSLDFVENPNTGDKIYQKIFNKVNQTLKGTTNYKLSGGSYDYLKNIEKISKSIISYGTENFLNKFESLFTIFI